MSLPTAFFIGRGGGSGAAGLQSTVTFDTGGQVGPTGPTSTSLLSYSSRSDIQALNFGVTATGIQYLDVPAAGDYNFNIRGASSVRQYYAGQESTYWGRGADFSGTFLISNSDQGNKLWIAVGQMPSNNVPVTTTYTGNVGNSGACFNGGGGGTFLGIGATLATAVPIIVAGGGGSQRTTYAADSGFMDARSNFVNSGHPGGGSPATSAGTNGNGGNAYNQSDQGTAGAGFYTRGDQNFTDAGSWSHAYSSSAEGFVQGARGAIAVNVGGSTVQPSGGFGGGGAGGWGGSGGGGGYNGGGGGTNYSSAGYGGGGGNYYETTRLYNVPNVVANHSGAGELTLTYVG